MPFPSIGKTPPAKPRTPEYLVTAAHPRSPAAEAYRVLRTNLQFLALEHPLRKLVITSAMPSEGKTLTAANLGVAMAQTGKRVVVVDADLRSPALHQYFDASHDRGLTTALVEDGGLDGLLLDSGTPGLSVLPSGPIPPNPAELLGSQRMATVMGELLERCDLVIFDTPPVIAVTDAAVLAAQADGVLLVVRSGMTGSPDAQKARDLLGNVQARILGIVLDDVRLNGESSYYYRYYGRDGGRG